MAELLPDGEDTGLENLKSDVDDSVEVTALNERDDNVLWRFKVEERL